MGLLKKYLNRGEVRPGRECIRHAQEIIKEQTEIRARIDRVAATLDGEDGWFLTLERKEKGGEQHV